MWVVKVYKFVIYVFYICIETMDALDRQISKKRQRVPKLNHSQYENIDPEESSDEVDQMKKKRKVCI